MAQGRPWWCWNTLWLLTEVVVTWIGPWDQTLWLCIHSCVWTHSSSKSSPVLQGRDMQPVSDGFKVEPSCNTSAPSWDSICCYCSVAQPCSTFATPQTAGRQASLSTISGSLLKSMDVYWVGDSIQPSHPLPPSSLFAFNLSQHQGLFQWVSSHVSKSEKSTTNKTYWYFYIYTYAISSSRAVLKSLRSRYSSRWLEA